MSERKFQRTLAREEWDFRCVTDDELLACNYWEYARESARIRAFYQPEASDFFPAPPMQPEIRTLDGRVFIKEHRQLIDRPRMQFSEQIWEYALPVRITIQKAGDAGILPEILSRPWQSLPSSVRREVVCELAPYFASHPALTFLPFNRCSDLRDIGLADENYRCAEFDREFGIEYFRAQIDWAQFTDAQIVRAFRIWVKENRPKGLGRANDKGTRKGAGLSSNLVWLAIMRLMNFHPYIRIGVVVPDAERLYRSADWPRARKNAERYFHKLFHFLPKEDRPIHSRTAGGRAR
jgi:hypothetical protein